MPGNIAKERSLCSSFLPVPQVELNVPGIPQVFLISWRHSLEPEHGIEGMELSSPLLALPILPKVELADRG